MSTVTVTKALIGKEDINLESADTSPSTFTRTKAGGGTQSITKLAAAHLNIEDSGSKITGTNVESALQELANIKDVFADGKGGDIASAATIAIPGDEFVFDVTGTTTITNITANSGAVDGRMVLLQFDAALTVEDSSNIQLDGDFESVAGDLLLLYYDGTRFREVAATRRHGVELHNGQDAGLVETASGLMRATLPADFGIL